MPLIEEQISKAVSKRVDQGKEEDNKNITEQEMKTSLMSRLFPSSVRNLCVFSVFSSQRHRQTEW